MSTAKGVNVGFFRCKDLEDAASTLAFYADHDNLDPETWLRRWGGARVMTQQRREIIARALEIMEERYWAPRRQPLAEPLAGEAPALSTPRSK